MASTDSLRDKAQFFRQLEAIGNPDDDDDDELDESEEYHRRQIKAFLSQPRQPLQERSQPEPPRLPASQQPKPNTRSVQSVPVPAALAELSVKEIIERTPLAEIKTHGSKDRVAAAAVDSSFVEDTPIPDSSTRHPLQPISSLARSATTPLTARRPLLPRQADNSPSVAAMKKRKRDAVIKTVPEEQQIFRGLRFYFIPNDDIAPARKIRIRKVQEYGAGWTRALQDATHVVVDKSLAWKNIESILSSADSASGRTVVNEDYPLDCIRFKALLNAGQKQYRVSGYPEQQSSSSVLEGQPSQLPVPVPSLRDRPLKSRQINSRKWGHAPQISTPSGSQVPSGRPGDEESTPSSPSVFHDAIPTGQPRTHSSPGQPTDGTDREEPTVVAERSELAHKDELEDAISQMQQFRHLPLEHDEEDHAESPTSPVGPESGNEGSEDEQKRKRRSSTRIRNQKELTWEDKFVCHKGGTKGGDQGNPNNRTIEILQQMCDYYTRTNDTWRPIAYRKAISQLKRQSTKISTAEEAIQLPGVGQRLADKIEEIVTTNRLKRLENAESEPMDEVLQTFLKIYGVGSVQASHWISQGFRSLEDLKAKAKLTTNQRVGIDHYEDLNKRIPRAEVKLLGAVVRSEAAKLDPNIRLIIGGSYRRGADDSGDIDFIVTKEGTKSTSELIPFLHQLVEQLEGQRFLVARLASSRDNDGSKWHGCCVLPKIKGFNDQNYRKIWRRVDFLLVPETEIGAALIYFTGNDIFNRSIRLLASKKGMRLNQRGLYKDVMRGPGRVRLSEGELVEGHDERKIFEILGVKWREPHERWC
ncbi:DNA polymerase [Colletotrichum musicola]|uniref:DNA polymerase lambda n=1 Tax=Colletotrichum musicola TaxID=2175873 RepID=A0A8H6NVZ6_9PEZI|nr:DNA polymerase [Colletotrichum musicola]